VNIRDLIGRPWALPCDPPDSFDCWALVEHVRAAHGLTVPFIVDKTQRTIELVRTIQRPPTAFKRLDAPKRLCVARIGKTHVGVYLGSKDVLHCQNGRGVVMDRLRDLSADVTWWEVADGHN